MNRKILALVFNIGLLAVGGVNAAEGSWWWPFASLKKETIVKKEHKSTTTSVSSTKHALEDAAAGAKDATLRGYNAAKSGIRYATSTVTDSVTNGYNRVNDFAFKGSRKYWTIGLSLAALALYKLYQNYLENEALEAELEEEGFYDENAETEE